MASVDGGKRSWLRMSLSRMRTPNPRARVSQFRSGTGRRHSPMWVGVVRARLGGEGSRLDSSQARLSPKRPSLSGPLGRGGSLQRVWEVR